MSDIVPGPGGGPAGRHGIAKPKQIKRGPNGESLIQKGRTPSLEKLHDASK